MSGRLDRYVRHLVSFAAGKAANAFIQAALIALLVRHLGPEGYGVWVIAFSLGSYLGIVDLNTNASVVKYTAELVATDRRAELAPMVNAGAQILFCCSFGLLALVLPMLPWIIPLIFKTAAYARPDLVLLSALCLLSFALVQTGNVYTQVLQGLLRQDEVNSIAVLGVLTTALAALLVLSRGMDIAWLGAASLAGNGALLLVTRWRVRRLAPELPWLPLRSTPAWRRTLLRFTAGSYAFTLWGWFYFTVPELILATQLGPVWVGYFDIATRLGSQGRNLVQTLSQYLIPFMSESSAREGSAKVHAQQVRALTFIWMLGLGVGGFVFALRAPMIAVWLPGTEPALLFAVAWVVVEFTAGGLAMPWVHFALAEGRLGHARPFLGYIIPACVLGPLLGLLYGPALAVSFPGFLPWVHLPDLPIYARFAGFLMGGALANVAGTALFYVLAVRERGLDAGALAFRLGRVVLGFVLGLLVLALFPWSPSMPGLIAAGALWGAVLLLSWLAFGLYDRELVGRLLGKIGIKTGTGKAA
jgi:O-antigen/teichoic acid export membrane protein